MNDLWKLYSKEDVYNGRSHILLKDGFYPSFSEEI